MTVRDQIGDPYGVYGEINEIPGLHSETPSIPGSIEPFAENGDERKALDDIIDTCSESSMDFGDVVLALAVVRQYAVDDGHIVKTRNETAGSIAGIVHSKTVDRLLADTVEHDPDKWKLPYDEQASDEKKTRDVRRFFIKEVRQGFYDELSELMEERAQ